MRSTGRPSFRYWWLDCENFPRTYSILVCPEGMKIVIFTCDVHPGQDLHAEPDYSRVLLRIMHLFEEGEDPELSKPVTVNLKVFNETPPLISPISLKQTLHCFALSIVTSCVNRMFCRASGK